MKTAAIWLALCSAVLAGNHNMIEKQNHIMIQAAPPPGMQVLAPSTVPVVTVFGLVNCPPCLQMEQEVQGNTEYSFKFVKDISQHPNWLHDYMDAKSWSFPVVYWESGGEWKASQWGGLAHFRKQFPPNKKSMGVVVEAKAAPTPWSEVIRVLNLLPKPEVGFVDFGCGDARWCIAAAEKWQCKVTGIEIDPARAAVARERVAASGLGHLIIIVTGDAITTSVEADVGVAYLYEDVLLQLKPRLQELRAFASYMHRPPGLPVVQNGDTWIYVKQFTTQQVRAATWGGAYYSNPVCSSPGCAMCNSIRSQLNNSNKGKF